MVPQPPRPDRRAPTSPAGADWAGGLSIAGLLLPEAMAYAGIAGLPPQAGVVALFAGLLAYGLLGSSRFAIVASTSLSAAVLAAAMASVLHVSDGQRHMMGVAMVMMAGLVFALAGQARLGSVSQFIAKPVLRGFALALTIVVKQLPVAVGVHPAHSDFLRYAWDLLAQWRQWNPYGLAMLLAALLVLRLLARWRAVPGALLVIAAGIALDALGYCEAWGIPAVGSLALGGSRPEVPALALADWLRAGQLAMALALILYAESYSSIRSLAMRSRPTATCWRWARPMRCRRCSRECRWGRGIRPARPTWWLSLPQNLFTMWAMLSGDFPCLSIPVLPR